MVSGSGLAEELLLKNKIKVYTENDFSREDLIQFQKDEGLQPVGGTDALSLQTRRQGRKRRTIWLLACYAWSCSLLLVFYLVDLFAANR